MATLNEAIEATLRLDMSQFQSGLAKAERQVSRDTKEMSSGFSSLGKAVVGLGAALGGLAIAKNVASSFFQTNREAEKLFASLKTVTGSAENATAAFAGIEKFASETPFQVEQITTAFIRMKSLGLDPSEDALRSYGNTASAMGMDLMQFVEAVADATTGEFERLKEFGIKAKSEGENVSLTFQGVTTTIGKNAEEINRFLRSIGENQFAGAMAEQMDTLNGIISNIQDNINSIFRSIGGGGGLNTALGDLLAQMRDITAEMAAQPDVIAKWTNFAVTGITTIAGNIKDLVLLAISFGEAMVSAMTFDLEGVNAAGVVGRKLMADISRRSDDLVFAWEDLNTRVATVTQTAQGMATAMERVATASEDVAGSFNSNSLFMPEFNFDTVEVDGKRAIRAINLEMVELNKDTTDWGAAIREIDAPADKLKRDLGRMSESAASIAASFVRGKASLGDMLKSLAKMGLTRGLGALIPGGNIIGSFLGGLFRHGTTRIPHARSGMMIPAYPGGAGTPIMAHSGEAVLTRRAASALGPENIMRLNRSPESFTLNGGISVHIDASGSGDPASVGEVVRRVLPDALKDAMRRRRV